MEGYQISGMPTFLFFKNDEEVSIAKTQSLILNVVLDSKMLVLFTI